MFRLRTFESYLRMACLGGLTMFFCVPGALADAIDDAVSMSQEMAREAYNFGYQYGGCESSIAGTTTSKRLKQSLAMYSNLCQEGVKDKQAGKPANPDQAGVSMAEEMAVLAYRENNHAEARKWFEVAAKAGRARAQLMLGNMCRVGGGGPKDCNMAIHWLQKAVDNNNAEAQFIMGSMYHEGQCVKVDYQKAASLYESAMGQEHAQAWTSTGVMLANGQGYQQNTVAAYVYLRIGSSLGDPYADELLQQIPFSDEQIQAGEEALRKMTEDQ